MYSVMTVIYCDKSRTAMKFTWSHVLKRWNMFDNVFCVLFGWLTWIRRGRFFQSQSRTARWQEIGLLSLLRKCVVIPHLLILNCNWSLIGSGNISICVSRTSYLYVQSVVETCCQCCQHLFWVEPHCVKSITCPQIRTNESQICGNICV